MKTYQLHPKTEDILKRFPARCKRLEGAERTPEAAGVPRVLCLGADLEKAGAEVLTFATEALTGRRKTNTRDAAALARLDVFRPVLAALDTQIAALTVTLEKAASPDLPGGVGKLTQVVISREVCDWARFKNRRQVSSYTGLCPGEYSSGGKRLPGRVTKHGNPRLRAALVELAWRLVRFQPGYGPIKKRLTILAKGARATGVARKKAIVAVARQLAVDLWRWQTGRCTAAQLGFQP